MIQSLGQFVQKYWLHTFGSLVCGHLIDPPMWLSVKPPIWRLNSDYGLSWSLKRQSSWGLWCHFIAKFRHGHKSKFQTNRIGHTNVWTCVSNGGNFKNQNWEICSTWLRHHFMIFPFRFLNPCFNFRSRCNYDPTTKAVSDTSRICDKPVGSIDRCHYSHPRCLNDS